MTKLMAKMATLIALGLVAAPVAVQAEDAMIVTKAEVKYRDLDLTRASHQAKLDKRIAYAVTKVCGQASPSTLSLNADIAKCRADALQGAKSSARVAIAEAQQQRALASNPAPVVGN